MALADNRAKIQALLDGINALPEAGSGEPADPVLQEKSVTPTKAAQAVTPDTGYDGLSKVNVGAIPEEYIVPSGTVSITENGTHDVTEAEKVNVNVPAPEPVLQEKSVTPSKTAQTVTADAGFDGLSAVGVGAIPDEYIVPTGEKSITANGQHDVAAFASVNVAVESDPVELQEKTVAPTTSAQTVTPDSGFDGLSKVTVNAMPTATQATPSIEVSSGGLITAKATQAAGYVAEGEKSATKQLTVQGAQTITPGTADKTIAAGRYLTGVQTIKGDANLQGVNISEGTSIFGVAGTNPYEKTATDATVATQEQLLDQALAAIAGKAAGGGLKVATGSFTPASASVSSNPVVVTGLGFSPQYVVAYLGSNPSRQSGSRVMTWILFSDGTPHYVSATGSSSGVTGSYYTQGGTADSWGTLDADGFTIRGSMTFFASEYKYIAVG